MSLVNYQRLRSSLEIINTPNKNDLIDSSVWSDKLIKKISSLVGVPIKTMYYSSTKAEHIDIKSFKKLDKLKLKFEGE